MLSFVVFMLSSLSLVYLEHLDLNMTPNFVCFSNPHDDMDLTSSTDFEDSLLPIADSLAFVEQDLSFTFDLFSILLPTFIINYSERHLEMS